MTKYTLPKTAALADKAAGSLLSEATEKEWALAALVYAQVLPHGKRKEYLVDLPVSRQTPVQFAARGVRGLTSDKTVRNYRATWQAAVDKGLVRGDIKLGDTIELPPNEIQIDGETVPSWGHFYPGDPRDGTEERHVPKDVARERAKAAIKANPSIVAEAVKEDDNVRNAAAKASREHWEKKHQAAITNAAARQGISKEALQAKLDQAQAEQRQRDADFMGGVMAEAERRDGLRLIEQHVETVERMASTWAEKHGHTGVFDEVEQLHRINSMLTEIQWKLTGAIVEQEA